MVSGFSLWVQLFAKKQVQRAPVAQGPWTTNGITWRHGAVQDFVLQLVHDARFVADSIQTAWEQWTSLGHTMSPSRPIRQVTDLTDWCEHQEKE